MIYLALYLTAFTSGMLVFFAAHEACIKSDYIHPLRLALASTALYIVFWYFGT